MAIRECMKLNTYLYSKILPHSWWGPLARKLARWLDMYVLRELRRRHNIHVREVWARELFEKRFQLMECMMLSMLKTDCVHLNKWGKKGLIRYTCGMQGAGQMVLENSRL